MVEARLCDAMDGMNTLRYFQRYEDGANRAGCRSSVGMRTQLPPGWLCRARSLTKPTRAWRVWRPYWRVLNRNPCPIRHDGRAAVCGRFQVGWKIGMGDRDPDDNRRNGMIERRVPASRSALYRPALIAACIGIVLSLAAAYAVGQWEERVTRVEFGGAAETEAIVMQNGLNEYISRLVALRTLFESANEEITRSEFETFSGRLFEGHPGVLRVAWVPRVNRKERAEYEAASDRRRHFRLSDQVSRRRRLDRDIAGARRIFSGAVLHRAEDLDDLRARLSERSRAARDAGTRA